MINCADVELLLIGSPNVRHRRPLMAYLPWITKTQTRHARAPLRQSSFFLLSGVLKSKEKIASFFSNAGRYFRLAFPFACIHDSEYRLLFQDEI